MTDEVFDRAAAYEDADGRIVYRASALGSCPGALVRARLGVTGSMPTDAMQIRYDEGHDYEAEVIMRGLGVDWVQVLDPDKLAFWGKKVVESDAGPQIETEIAWGGDKGKVVRCHPDGIAIRGSTLEPFVVEAKFFADGWFEEATRDFYAFLDAHPTYKWQASVESISTGLPLLYIIGQKDVIEVDGERVLRGVGEVLTVEVDGDRLYTLKDVKARVLEIEGFVARGEMPPCPVPFDYPCPYWDHHEKAEKDEITDEAMVAWIDVWRRAKDDLVKAESAMEFVRGAIAEQMKELGVTAGVCEGVELATVPAQDKGNVSWKKAYDALKKQTGESVDEDKFRGVARAGYVRIEAKDA